MPRARPGPAQTVQPPRDASRAIRWTSRDRPGPGADTNRFHQPPRAALACPGGDRQQQAPDGAREETHTRYGVVTSADIAQPLKGKGVEIDKKKHSVKPLNRSGTMDLFPGSGGLSRPIPYRSFALFPKSALPWIAEQHGSDGAQNQTVLRLC